MKYKLLPTLLLAGATFSVASEGAWADTVADITARGTLNCSANAGSYFGFAEITDSGDWRGYDIDFCRAAATAILGDPTKVNFVQVTWANRFPALQSGELDVVFKATTWNLSRDAEAGFQFTLPYFYAGNQIIVHSDSGFEKAADLDGATGCGITGASTELVFNDYMANLGIKPKLINFENADDAMKALEANRCDYYVSWGPTLAVAMAQKGDKSSDYTLLPEVMSLDIIAGAVRQGDDHFLDVMNWTIAVLVQAEQLGVTSGNVDELLGKSDLSPDVARLLGKEPGIGAKLGLRDSWAADVIRAVGNYGEIYDRNLGSASPYKLNRGLNKLWNAGGLISAPQLN